MSKSDDFGKMLEEMANIFVDAQLKNLANELADNIISETRKMTKDVPMMKDRVVLLYETVIKKLEDEMNNICEEGGGIKVE